MSDFLSDENLDKVADFFRNSGQLFDENLPIFINKINKLLDNEISWWLWIMLVFSVILFLGGFGSFGSSGEIDNRTKTGYRDNEIPDPGNPGQGCLMVIISIVVFYFSWSLI